MPSQGRQSQHTDVQVVAGRGGRFSVYDSTGVYIVQEFSNLLKGRGAPRTRKGLKLVYICVVILVSSLGKPLFIADGDKNKV